MIRKYEAFLAIAAFLCVLWPPISSMAWLQASAAKATNVDTAANDSDATDPAETDRWGSARKALRTFVIAMEGKDYRTAILTLDFSSIAPSPDSFTQISYAQRLKACMDRLSLVDASQFSDDANADPVTFPPDKADSDIILSRGDDGNWKFTAKTVAEIDSIYEVLKDSPPLGQELAVASEPTTEDRQTTDESPAASTDPDGEVMVQEAAAIQVPDELKSARRTMRSLFESLESKDYALAVRALDFSAVEEKDPELGPYARLERARRLKEIIERMASIDYAAISDDPEGPTFRFPAKEPNQPIVIGRDETRVWRFTADTVAKIDSLHELYKNEPILNVSDEQKPWYDRKLVLGNETWRLLALFAAIFSSLLLGQVSKAMLLWWADQFERRGSNLRAVVAKTLAASAVGILFLIGLNIGMRMLVLEHEVETFVTTTIRVIFSLVVGYISFRLVDVAVEMLRELAKRTGSTLNNMLVPIVSTSLRLTVIVTVVLDIATAVSDQPPSTVLAGLGAGGLAIGLAAQDTIKNLFGSVMIFADRPFELGDRIVIDGHDGPVERVGFRSTRIRTLDGHLVTIPNGEMANKTIRNIGKRPFIKRIFDIRIAYDTAPAQVQMAIQILRDLLQDHDGMEDGFPPRVFLHEFLDSAINVRVTYWYHPPDYWEYCAFSERLNMQVVERFQAEGIRFALPSQRLVLDADSQLPSRDG